MDNAIGNDMNSEFFVLTIVADCAAELMGLHGESSIHVDRLRRTQHNLITTT